MKPATLTAPSTSHPLDNAVPASSPPQSRSEQRRRLLQWPLATLAAAPWIADGQPTASGTSPSSPAATTAGVDIAPPSEEVPYVQTPQGVVRRMLQLAEVGHREVLWDLGSGDGRIVIAAARDFGARGVGYEIDPQLIAESRRLARKAAVAARAVFLERDLFTLAFAKPDVVTLYLLPEFNARLRPLLLAQMRPGSRVVSHEWDMGDWLPDETLLVRTPAKPHGLSKEHKVMLWFIPAAAAGKWQIDLRREGSSERLAVRIDQDRQMVTASADSGRILWAGLRGKQLSIAWQDGSARWLLSGEVEGNRWRGGIKAIAQWSNTSDEVVGHFSATRA